MGMQTYYDIKKMLCKELDEMTYNGNGRIKNREELELIDLLTHSIKSVETVIAMNEAQESGKSGHFLYPYGMNSFESNEASNRSRSRGLSNAQKRNAMGQFSRESYESRGYSREEADMMSNLHDLMARAKDDHTRKKFQRFIEDLEEE